MNKLSLAFALFCLSYLSSAQASLCNGMLEVYADVKYRREYYDWNTIDGTNPRGAFKKFKLNTYSAGQAGGGFKINPFLNSCGLLNGVFVQVDGGAIFDGRGNRLNTKFVSGLGEGYTTLDNPKTRVRGNDITVLAGKTFCVGDVFGCLFKSILSNLELTPVFGYFYQERRFQNNPGEMPPRSLEFGIPIVFGNKFKQNQEWQAGVLGIHTKLTTCTPLTLFGGYEYLRGSMKGWSSYDVTETDFPFVSTYTGKINQNGHFNGFRTRSGVEYAFCSGIKVGLWYRFEWTEICQGKYHSRANQTTVGPTVPLIPQTTLSATGKVYSKWWSSSLALNIGYEF